MKQRAQQIWIEKKLQNFLKIFQLLQKYNALFHFTQFQMNIKLAKSW